MKNKFLMMMFFFAFMIMGVQSVSAQYVPSGQALNLLQTELTNVQSNPVYNGSQENNPLYGYLVSKKEFYTVVYEKIVEGDTVANAIQTGVNETASVTIDSQMDNISIDQGELAPLHQEIVDLLEQ